MASESLTPPNQDSDSDESWPTSEAPDEPIDDVESYNPEDPEQPAPD